MCVVCWEGEEEGEEEEEEEEEGGDQMNWAWIALNPSQTKVGQTAKKRRLTSAFTVVKWTFPVGSC